MALFDHTHIRGIGPAQRAVGTATGDGTSGERLAVTALADGGYAVAWMHRPEGGAQQVWVRSFTAAGVADTVPLRASTLLQDPGGTTPDQWTPAITAAGDGFMVAWTTVEYNFGYNTGRNIMARIYDAAGRPVAAPFVAALEVNPFGDVTTSSWESQPALATLTDGRIVMAFANDGEIGLKMFSSTGQELMATWQANGLSDGRQGQPRLTALADGGFLVVWEDDGGNDGSDYGAYARQFNAQGTATGPDFVLSDNTYGSQYLPNVTALAGGGFVATYSTNYTNQTTYDEIVLARVFRANGTPSGTDLKIRPEGDVWFGNLEGSEVIALSDGGFVVLYSMNTAKPGNTYGDSDCYMRRFTAEGKPLGDELRVNPGDGSVNDGHQLELHGAALDNGRLLLSWHDGATGAVVSRIVELSDINGQGTAGNDFITLAGVGRARSLLGGHDALVGGNGADTVAGGGGNDSIAGGGAGDQLSGGLGVDRIEGGTGDDLISGDGGNDRLWGEAGRDSLAGGAGKDTLWGGAGADELSGGTGADHFVFALGDSGLTRARDLITDFETGIDRIDLTALDLHFLGTAAFDGSVGALRFARAGGEGVLQIDLNGDSKADMAIRLTGITAMNEADLIL